PASTPSTPTPPAARRSSPGSSPPSATGAGRLGGRWRSGHFWAGREAGGGRPRPGPPPTCPTPGRRSSPPTGWRRTSPPSSRYGPSPGDPSNRLLGSSPSSRADRPDRLAPTRGTPAALPSPAVPAEKVRLRIGNLAKAVLVTGQA